MHMCGTHIMCGMHMCGMHIHAGVVDRGGGEKDGMKCRRSGECENVVAFCPVPQLENGADTVERADGSHLRTVVRQFSDE